MILMGRSSTRTTAVAIVLTLAAGAAEAAARDRPDLTVGAVADPPAFAAPGSTFTAEDVTVNGGRRRASRSWTGYRLSPAGLVGGRPVPALLRRQRSRGSAMVTVPSWIADGAYRLVACADALHTVRERDERDNCRSPAGLLVVDTTPPPAPLIEAHPDATTASHVARFAFFGEEAGTAIHVRARRRPADGLSESARVWPRRGG